MLLKKFPREKFLAKKIERATPGVETKFIPHIAIPARIIRLVIIRGIFGRDLIVKRRWGWTRAKIIIKITRYIKWGV